MSVAEVTAAVSGLMAAWRPRLLVVDTFPPRGLVAAAARHAVQPVLVLEKLRPKHAGGLLAQPELESLKAIALPFSEDELGFGEAAPFWKSLVARDPRVRVVGPLVRRASARSMPDHPHVLLTSGGGGYREEASRLRRATVIAMQELRREHPQLGLDIVVGPYASVEAPEAPWVRLRQTDPSLPAQLAAAKLVVSHAGYNSVHEALAAGVPLVLCPGERRAESQEERAAWCAARGWAHAVSAPDAALLAQAMKAALEERHPPPALYADPAQAGRAVLDLAAPARSLVLDGGAARESSRYGSASGEEVVVEVRRGTTPERSAAAAAQVKGPIRGIIAEESPDHAAAHLDAWRLRAGRSQARITLTDYAEVGGLARSLGELTGWRVAIRYQMQDVEQAAAAVERLDAAGRSLARLEHTWVFADDGSVEAALPALQRLAGARIGRPPIRIEP